MPRLGPSRTLLAALLLAPAAPLYAEAPAGGLTSGAPLGGEAPAIRRLVRLPTQGLQAVETADGQLLYLSDNGRYLVRGDAYDLWHGTKLDSLDRAETLAGRIDLQRLRLDPAELGALALGQGPEVWVFVDPRCPHCAALLRELPALAGRYRFRAIPLPIAPESQADALALHCLASRDPAAALTALLDGTAPPPAAPGGCGQATAQRALVVAQLLGVRGTPFLIAPDGRLHQGRPADLAGWLAAGASGAAGEGAR